MQFDSYDLRILAALQEDCALSNETLAPLINLPMDELIERRSKLEDEGVISGYTAIVDRTKSGFDIFAFVQVTLNDYERRTADKFAEFVTHSPFVLEAHAMTEEMDFLLKIVSRNLEDISSLISDQLETHESVKNVKTLISLETLKETTALPI